MVQPDGFSRKLLSGQGRSTGCPVKAHGGVIKKRFQVLHDPGPQPWVGLERVDRSLLRGGRAKGSLCGRPPQESNRKARGGSAWRGGCAQTGKVLEFGLKDLLLCFPVWGAVNSVWVRAQTNSATIGCGGGPCSRGGDLCHLSAPCSPLSGLQHGVGGAWWGGGRRAPASRGDLEQHVS